MVYVIVNDLSLKSKLLLIGFVLIWELLVCFGYSSIQYDNSIIETVASILLSIIPVAILVHDYWCSREITIDDQKKEINVLSIQKKNNVKICFSNISKIDLIDCKAYLSDYGDIYFDKIIIYDLNGNKVFEYEAKRILGVAEILSKDGLVTNMYHKNEDD